MNIIEKLQQSVYDATGLKLHYHNPKTLNEILDNVKLPCAFLFLINGAGVENVNGMLCEQLPINIYFADITDFDFESVENETIIQQCRANSNKWLKSLALNGDLKVVSLGESQRSYDKMGINLTGFAQAVTIGETYVTCD